MVGPKDTLIRSPNGKEAVDQGRGRHGPILRRTGEEEESSGDCMATVAGFRYRREGRLRRGSGEVENEMETVRLPLALAKKNTPAIVVLV